MVRSRVFISGLVQGVFFRISTKHEAEALGLSGWARNVYGEQLRMPDGKMEEFTGVEAVFEGGKNAVHEMIAWCWNGSPSAQVSDVKVSWENPSGLKGFAIRR